MRHRTTDSFWQLYDALPADIRKQADAAYAQLKADPRHPSLHFKRIAGDRWSARVSRRYRALALEVDGGYVWVWIGSHSDYDRILKRK